MMLVENKYNIGDLIFLKTDKENLRVITGILVLPYNVLMYKLSFGSLESWHYEMELHTEVENINDEDINDEDINDEDIK